MIADYDVKARTPWTDAEDAKMLRIAAADTPGRQIAMALRRTLPAVERRARKLGIEIWVPEPAGRETKP